MQNKVNNKSEIRCKYCNKCYASTSSLCNHNKKFHLFDGTLKSENGTLKYENGTLKYENGTLKSENSTLKSENSKKYNCRYCFKIYNKKSSRWSHEQKCKKHNIELNKNNNEITKIKEETKKIDAENKQKEIELLFKKQEEKILKLKLKLEKSNKVDNVTLRQLNKKLIERNNLIKNSNIHSNNNNQIQNNNIVNNNTFQLIGFGKEDIIELLTMQEKKQIMNAKFCCLEKLVEIIHCGNYNQFKNIIITNMKDNYIYKYDESKGQFVLSMKSNVLNSLIDCRVSDIEIIYNELVENNKLDNNTKDLVERFINRINNEDSKYTDIDGKEYETYRHHKINEVKVILYNNKDKINNDISLLLTTTDEILPVVKSSLKIEEIDY